jgi:broad specificity phosphatase PhoE
LFLVRHGQAGTRDLYDSLSDLGRDQSRRLGEYLVAQGFKFSAVYSGGLERQKQTAAEVASAYERAEVPFPSAIVDCGLDEFDLTRVYREIGPQLAEINVEFRDQFDEMRRQIKQNAGVQDAAVHRRWWPCDSLIVEAWISGRFRYAGESWEGFHERVSSCGLKLCDESPDANLLAFTSATPTGVLTAVALGAPVERIRSLAGVLYNSSYTWLRRRADRLHLFQFNAVPHLTTPELRTHR